jgi:thiol-disulfide isomerase/thioredoxin
MIVNLWASWCTPCRAELPAIQRYATTSGVTVIGVDTGDTTAAATSVIDDLGLTFPVLSDTGRSLLAAVGRSALPVTLFVDAQGGLRYLYNEGTALTEETLAALATAHLGVGG